MRAPLRTAPTPSASANSQAFARRGHGTLAPSVASASITPHEGRNSVRSATITSVGTITLDTGRIVSTSQTSPTATPGTLARSRHAASPATIHTTAARPCRAVRAVVTTSWAGL